jgi:hypothetical protein
LKRFAKTPLLQEFYENCFKNERKTHLAVAEVFQNKFSKLPFLKRKPCMDCIRGTGLIGEYHSEVIFCLTFLREEKEFEQGKVDKFPLT